METLERIGRAAPHPAPLLTRLNGRGFRLLQIADLTTFVGLLLGVMVLRHGWDWPNYPRGLYLISMAVTSAIFLTAMYFGGLYERAPRLGDTPVLPRAFRQTLGAGGLVALLNLAATGIAQNLGVATQRAFPIPTPNLIALIVLGAVGVAANRHISEFLRYRNHGPARLLLVGAPAEVEVARRHLRDGAARAVVVGEAHSSERLDETAADCDATEIALLTSGLLDGLHPDDIERLEEQGRIVLQRVGLRETMFGLERVRQIGGMPFTLLRGHTLPVSRARFKRVTDLTILFCSAPMWLIALVLVALHQLVVAGRPILFRQRRVGVGGSTFRMVKFRTMEVHAEEDGAPRLATQDDPRIIPGCRWLREMRLDELPQVFNVLRGQMSLVGPRPERPELTAEFERHIPGYRRRHETPPGMTGLAQIHGRYHTDAGYKLGYDLHYLANWSPVLDLEILARTIWVVLTRRI